MCQTMLISNRIVRLGTRSYRQRLEAAASNTCHVMQLVRLNRDLDDFYELLYDQWDTVTESDYETFGPQLQIMLNTLKELYDTCKKMPSSLRLGKETEKLGMNYSAIYEADSDIRNLKLKAGKDTEMKSLLQKASNATRTIQA